MSINDDRENPERKSKWKIITNNGLPFLIGVIFVVMLISPDAKTWMLRQLMVTGVFNAHIEEKDSDIMNHSAVDIDFVDDNGRIQNTSALKGKVVFINFWASWCPPCRAELPSIERLYSRLEDSTDIFFLMINEDNDLAVAREFLERGKYTFPVYRTSANLPDAVYSGTLPTTIVLDKRGGISFWHQGFANYGSEKFIKQMEVLMK